MTHPERLSQEEERRLLDRLKARDEGALAELYDELAPWVLGLAFRILQDEDEAEEVVGDVFVQVWRHIDRHDARRGPMVPWILSIARNRALDLMRRRRRWWRKAERWERARDIDGAENTPETSTVEASVPGFPVHREVHQALAALPEDQRRVVALAYFDGLSHSEIAARLKIPLGTVKTRIRIAQGKLSDALQHLKDWWT